LRAAAGFRDPAVVRLLLNDCNSASFWTIVRWYDSFTFFSAGYAKTLGLEVMNHPPESWLLNRCVEQPAHRCAGGSPH